MREKCRLAPAHLGCLALQVLGTFATFTGTELTAKLGNWEQRENSPVGPLGIFFGGAAGRPWRRAKYIRAAVLGLADCIQAADDVITF